MNTRHSESAFTLIELLVVVAIIAVLVAVLMPALQAARQQAKQVTCASNLKQIGTGISFYLDDYRTYPYIFRSYSFYEVEQWVLLRLHPYVAHPMWGPGNYHVLPQSFVFHCPNDPLDDNVGFDGMFHGNSYQFTYQFCGQRPISPLECNCMNAGGWDYHIRAQNLSKSPLYRDGPGVTPIHRGGHNYLFADYHVQWRPADKLLETYNYNAFYK